MISYKKLSKKAQRERNNEKRVTWAFSPVSRVKPSKKVYDRRAFKQAEELISRGV